MPRTIERIDGEFPPRQFCSETGHYGKVLGVFKRLLCVYCVLNSQNNIKDALVVSPDCSYYGICEFVICECGLFFADVKKLGCTLFRLVNLDNHTLSE